MLYFDVFVRLSYYGQFLEQTASLPVTSKGWMDG